MKNLKIIFLLFIFIFWFRNISLANLSTQTQNKYNSQIENVLNNFDKSLSNKSDEEKLLKYSAVEKKINLALTKKLSEKNKYVLETLNNKIKRNILKINLKIKNSQTTNTTKEIKNDTIAQVDTSSITDDLFDTPNSNNTTDENVFIDPNIYLNEIKDKVKQFVWVENDLKTLSNGINEISYQKIVWLNSSDDVKKYKNLLNSNSSKLNNEILLYNSKDKTYYITVWGGEMINLKEKGLNEYLAWNTNDSYSNYFNLKLYDWTPNDYMINFSKNSESNVLKILNNITNNEADILKWMDILIYENQVNFEKNWYLIIKKDNSSELGWFFTKLWNKQVVFIKSSSTDSTFAHELLHAIHNKQNLNLWYLEEWLAFFSWNFTNDVVYNWTNLNFTAYLWNKKIFYSENRVYKINPKIENKSNLNNYGESQYFLTWLYSKYWMEFIHELYSVAKNNKDYNEEQLITTAVARFDSTKPDFDTLFKNFVNEVYEISKTEFN